nr:hypothetical protein [Tanacetum cinerariifolium]
MASFKVLKTQFQMFIKSRIYLDDEYVVMTRNYFLQYTQLEILEFRNTLIQQLESIKKSIDNRVTHKREYDSRVNERQMQTTEGKVDTCKALDASLVDIESSGIDSKEHDTSNISGNDAHADGADIIPIYDEEPMAEHVETSIPTANPKTAIPKPTSNGKCRNRKACFVCKSLDHLIKDCDYHEKKMAQTTARNCAKRGTHKQYAQMPLPNPQRHVVLTAVLTQSKLVPITTVRLVTTADPKISVTRLRQAKTVITKTNSPPRRHINRSPSPTARKMGMETKMPNFRPCFSQHKCINEPKKAINLTLVQVSKNNLMQKKKGRKMSNNMCFFLFGLLVLRLLKTLMEMKPLMKRSLSLMKKKSESEVKISPSSSAQSKKHDDKTKIEDKGKSPVESFTGYRNLSTEFEDFYDNNINKDNVAGTLGPVVGQLSPNNTNTFSVAGPSNAATSPTHGKS